MIMDFDEYDIKGCPYSSDEESELVEDKTSKVMKSEEYPWMLLEQLNKQRMNNLYCDFTICIDDEEYPVHQGILAARSEYFNAMFTSKLKEGFEKRVEIKESSKQCVERILGFLYSGKIELSVGNIEETIRCAALMQIPDLLQAAADYVHSIFNAGNCIHFRGLAKLHSMDDLVKKADKYVLDHFRDVCLDGSWNELSAEDVEMFISSEDVVESEEVVYECMVGWVKHDLPSRKQYFPTLFRHIKFGNLCTNFIRDVIKIEELVYEFHDCCKVVCKHYFDNIRSTPTCNPKKGDFPDVNVTYVSDVRYGNFILNENKVEVKQNKQRGYRESITASTVHKNKVYICSNNQVKSYDGKTWEDITTLPNNMQCQYMVICESKHFWELEPYLFVFGKKSETVNKVTTTNEIVRFDFQSKRWENYQRITFPFREGAVLISDGRRIFILGGKQFDDIGARACSFVDIYKDTLYNQAYTRGKDMQVARRNFAAVKLHSKIYCFGGIGLNNAKLSSGEFMNIADGVWTMLTNNIPLQLGRPSACCVGDHIVMYGSSCHGKICSINSYTEEWKIWSENQEKNKLLREEGILFTSCP